MKAIKYVSMAAIALAMAACSSENEEVDNWNGEIRLSSGVSVQTRADNSADVPDKQIAYDEEIGIYVSGVEGETAYEDYLNVKAVADGNGNFDNYTMYYPQSGKNVKIKAYHPFENGRTDTYDFIVKEDQSEDNNYYKSDLLYSTEATFARSKIAHSLTFTHKLAKIFCTLKASAGISTIEGAIVQVLGVEKAAKFNRTDGTVSPAITSVTGNVTLGKYGAIIAPQTISSGQLLKIKLSDKAGSGEYYYTTTAGTTFEGGNIYQYEITVTATELKVTSTILPWKGIEGDPVKGTATLPENN